MDLAAAQDSCKTDALPTSIFPHYTIANSLALDKKGNIVITGNVSEGFSNYFCTIRYTLTVNIDTLFNHTGVLLSEKFFGNAEFLTVSTGWAG